MSTGACGGGTGGSSGIGSCDVSFSGDVFVRREFLHGGVLMDFIVQEASVPFCLIP